MSIYGKKHIGQIHGQGGSSGGGGGVIVDVDAKIAQHNTSVASHQNIQDAITAMENTLTAEVTASMQHNTDANAHPRYIAPADIAASDTQVTASSDSSNLKYIWNIVLTLIKNVAYLFLNKTTPADVDTKITQHNTDNTAHSDIRTAINGKTSPADVDTKIATHNTSGTAHSDIRTALDGKEPAFTILPISKGGTGANTATQAFSNLGGRGAHYSGNNDYIKITKNINGADRDIVLVKQTDYFSIFAMKDSFVGVNWLFGNWAKEFRKIDANTIIMQGGWTGVDYFTGQSTLVSIVPATAAEWATAYPLTVNDLRGKMTPYTTLFDNKMTQLTTYPQYIEVNISNYTILKIGMWWSPKGTKTTRQYCLFNTEIIIPSAGSTMGISGSFFDHQGVLGTAGVPYQVYSIINVIEAGKLQISDISNGYMFKLMYSTNQDIAWFKNDSFMGNVWIEILAR